MTDFLSILKFDSKKVNEYSPLVLAYIGDCVYELFIRSKLVCMGNAHVNKLHKSTVSYVCAHAQSESINKILDTLTDDEISIFKRGRNTNSAVPKNSDMAEYRNATGFEALIGYLYLKGDSERLNKILSMSLE